MLEALRRKGDSNYPKLFIHPLSTIAQVWEFIINTGTVVSLLIVPYALVFSIQ